MSKPSFKNFSWSLGDEGDPKNPYQFLEYRFSYNGREYVVHIGVTEWVLVDGWLRWGWSTADQRRQMVKNKTGLELSWLRRLQEKYSKMEWLQERAERELFCRRIG